MTTRVPAQMVGLSPVSGDNALQINAAISMLAAAGGGTVELAAGDFPTATTIVMQAGVDLLGQGMLATQIRPAAVDGITFNHLETYGNSRISNLGLATTTVGGTLNSQLRIAIPGGRVAAKRTCNPCFLLDNNVRASGYLEVTAAGTTIIVQRVDGANYTASTNQTSVFGQITFEVQ